MPGSMYCHIVRGERIDFFAWPLLVDNNAIVIEDNSAGIELFHNEEKSEYQIKIHFLGSLYTISSYSDKREAKDEFGRIKEGLTNRSLRVKITSESYRVKVRII